MSIRAFLIADVSSSTGNGAFRAMRIGRDGLAALLLAVPAAVLPTLPAAMPAILLATLLAILPTALPAAAETALKFTLDGRIEVANAPFFVALDRGLFKEAGLDVTIAASAGGIEPLTRVASGSHDIGIADINALIRFRDQNPAAPVKAIYVVANRPGYAVIGRKSRGVAHPEDLNRKRIGIPAAENAALAWPAFARLNGVDLATVQTLNVGAAVREPMLAAGEVDAVTGVGFGSPITLREKGVPAEDITTMLMGRFGVALYGTVIIVNTAVLAERPDAVRGFLKVVNAAIKDTVGDPAAAIGSVLRHANGIASPAIELERLRVVIRDSISTRETRRNGLGDVDPARFDAGLEQLAVSHGFKNRPSLADVFDPSYLPPAEERRVN